MASYGNGLTWYPSGVYEGRIRGLGIDIQYGGRMIAMARPWLPILAPLIVIVSLSGCAIPFVEGEWETLKGEAYGFTVGASRADSLNVARAEYGENQIRVLWPVDSPFALELRPFENTPWASYSHRKNSEYQEKIADIPFPDPMHPPLQYADRWEVKLPASWKNEIDLYFESDRLIKIVRSRYLFERP